MKVSLLLLKTKFANCPVFSKIYDRLMAMTHFFLLKNSVAIPRLLYALRTCRCYSHPLLVKYDQILRLGLELIVNTSIDDAGWSQATLPVSYGGLGIRRAVDLAMPSFFSSAFCVRQAVSQLVQCHSFDDVFLGTLHDAVLMPETTTSQRAWDALQCERQRNELLRLAPEGSVQKRRLLAAAAPQSGVWLNALPSSTLGLKLDNDQLSRGCIKNRRPHKPAASMPLLSSAC